MHLENLVALVFLLILANTNQMKMRNAEPRKTFQEGFLWFWFQLTIPCNFTTIFTQKLHENSQNNYKNDKQVN